MNDFICMDWDLQAIVRGCSSSSSTDSSIDSIMDRTVQSCVNNFSPLRSLQQDVIFKFPDVSETTTIIDELEELYKPFYPQTILTSSASTSIYVPTEVNKKPKKLRKQSMQQQPKLSDYPAAKPKRGKNHHKRVVRTVTAADGLVCDKWAWRKYGQKPIKGSPHPRSYYRCSSSKGCLARKQVERSSTDPGVFIITYSAEHNHTHPTRRSSLAGSTRNKASTARGPATKEPAVLIKPTDETPLVVTTSSIKEENEIIVMPDMIFSDDMFPSLEDLEGLLLDQFPDHNISDDSWFIDESLTLNGSC